jgi:hypothetical protein
MTKYGLQAKVKKFIVYKNPIVWQSSKYFADVTAAILLALLYSHRIFQLLRMLLVKEEIEMVALVLSVCSLDGRPDGSDDE